MSEGLLWGAGTGKTLLARATAAECGASFLAIHPSTVASKWLGDGVRYVRACFSLAAKLAPCVLFVDEVRCILSSETHTRDFAGIQWICAFKTHCQSSQRQSDPQGASLKAFPARQDIYRTCPHPRSCLLVTGGCHAVPPEG